MMRNNNYYKVLALIMLLTGCFGIVFLSAYAFQYVFTFILFLFVYIGRHISFSYKKLLILYTIFVLLSCLYSGVFNEQNVLKTIVASYPSLGILSIFGISYLSLDKKGAHKLLETICLLFCMSYVIQWLVYPIQIFAGSMDEVNINDEEFRMRMPCSICAYLLFFYGVERLLYQFKTKYLFYSALGFFPILTMGFRSLTVLSVFMAILMVVSASRNIGKAVLVLIAFSLIGFVTYHVPYVKYKVNEMMERQNNNQTFNNSDYIRYVEYEYFTEQVFVKPGERFIGAGYPVMDNQTKYGQTMYNASYRNSLYWVDLGLVGLSFMIGIPAVIILVCVIILCCIRCGERYLRFIRFSLLTILLGSIITSMELFRSGNLILVGFLLYYEYLYHKNGIEEK